MLIETCHYSNFAFIDIVHNIVNFDCDFILLPSVPVHYYFQTLNLNCELSIQC